MFNKMSIATKLFACTAATFLLTAILGYYGMESSASLQKQFDTAITWTINKWTLANRIELMEKEMVADQRGIILSSFANEQKEVEKMHAAFEDHRQKLRQALEKIRPMLVKQEARSIIDSITKSVDEWAPHYEKLLRAARAGRAQEANIIRREFTAPLYTKIGNDAGRLGEIQVIVLDETSAGIKQGVQTQRTISLVLIALCLLLGGVTLLVTRTVTGPIGDVARHLQQIANGDLTKDAPLVHRSREDEIGQLANAKQSMIETLRKMVGDMSSGVQVLAASSAELRTNSNRVTEGANQASGKAHAVAAAAEQMTANTVSVAAGMEQTTTNLGTVASASERMTSTIEEIASNSEKARRITEEATRQAETISQQMDLLGSAAREIGKVTETITEISSQTNLLALNATIEAARAGAAGKGFAVVATEIKQLAHQTAAATEDIKSRIAGVQSSAASGISEIAKISNVIKDVSDIVDSIASAIEEQSAVTRDIARNIGEASTGVQDANERISQSSQATAEIAREIAGVDEVARNLSEGGENVNSSATELAKVAEQLQAGIAQFRV